ncbi:unnamed protein product [Ectocarpus sp. 12 AP-2014]
MLLLEHYQREVLACIALAAALAALLLWWSRGMSEGRSSGGAGTSGSKKPLAHTPGIRAVYMQDSFAEGSDGGGWGSSSSSTGQGDGRAAASSKWEQSKQKGDLGYYFAHHITMKELAPEDYQMNGPKLLSKGDTTSGPNGARPNGSSSASSPLVTTRRRRPEQISSYSWEDYGEEVRLTFRQSEWEWAKVDADEIEIEWGSRRFRMSIDSREYGLHTIDLQRLSGDVVGVRARKLKTRLVVALVKGGRRGSYSHRPAWSKLQTALEKPSD